MPIKRTSKNILETFEKNHAELELNMDSTNSDIDADAEPINILVIGKFEEQARRTIATLRSMMSKLKAYS